MTYSTLAHPQEQKDTISASVEDPQTQRNFNVTLKKLWRRVEMMKRTNRYASAYYGSRHKWFWFIPISTCIILSMLLSMATALDFSGRARLYLAMCTGFFSCVAFLLNFFQGRMGWSSRAEVHRSAEVELGQVAFRLDTLGKYEGRGLTMGAHTTKQRANAIRDLYRIDVYLQAMQRCTPPIPEGINEMFYLLASRLKGICMKYPNAVKARASYYDNDKDDGDDGNPVPVDMQIDALDLLGQEIEKYWLYPLFMPNARDVASRTIDIFFAGPTEEGHRRRSSRDEKEQESIYDESQYDESQYSDEDSRYQDEGSSYDSRSIYDDEFDVV